MKRVCDVMLSLAALILLAPVFALVALIIFFDDGAPVLYRQDRVGKNNELFKIRKFRTMCKSTSNDKAKAAREMKNADCYIRSGKILRSLSLDELPQLWNILEGTMSFVGPRPLIPEEDEIRKLRAQEGIYDLLPGLTGWAQVNGRATLSDEEKTRLDAEYRAKRSIKLDLQILFKTALQVIARKDVE